MTALTWTSIVRLGLVQAALGGVVVLTTSTLNRVMVVELALPALVPGLLVAIHYAMQLARPRMGHGTDLGGRSTPWIVGGMVVLAAGGVVAASATAWMATHRWGGLALAAVGFALVGLGVSSAGTALLVLLAKRVEPQRRAAAATVVWMMMIAGFAITAGLAGQLLDPYSGSRLIAVSSGVSVLAVLVVMLAVRGVEPVQGVALQESQERKSMPFRAALAQIWQEPVARRFTIFVFVSMLAYSGQDLILEPFAGSVFGFTPGQSTQLAGLQHGGVLLGMLLAATGRSDAALRRWTVFGCVASAFALLGLTFAGLAGPGWPLQANVVALGMANGAFSIGAIGSMMRLADAGGPSRQGIRMGLWGASQAVAFALGGLVGTAAADLARVLIASPATAYATVFGLEALLFLVSAGLAWRLGTSRAVGADGRPARLAAGGA